MRKSGKPKQIREIRIRDLICYYYLTLAAFLLLSTGFVLLLVFLKPLWAKLVAIPVYLLLLYFIFKKHAIGCVLMYKAYAPLDVRARCRFEPTCSTYMILAIQKYGLFRGLIKGIKRLRRCKPPNGGIDYP